MGFIAKLVHGSQTLDLNSAPFSLAPGWAPPGVNYTPQMTSGTMANSFAGGDLVGEKLLDREMSIPLQIKSASNSSAQTHAAVSRIDDFLRRNLSDKSKKIFFIYAPSDAIPYTPMYGQLFYKYEIKANLSGNLSEQLYLISNIRAAYLELNMSFIVAPTSAGNRQLVGSATGGVLEHSFGTPGGESRGLLIPPATKNEMTNPIFSHGTPLNGWTAVANLIATYTSDPEFVLFGKNAAKITRIDAGSTLYQSITVDSVGDAYTLSGYFKKADGTAVGASDLALRYDATLSTTFLSIGNGWYKATASLTGLAGAQTTGVVLVAVGVTVYCGGFQLEQKTYASPLCHGDMIDCVWDGTAHASESTRTAARWRVPTIDVCNIAEWTAIITMRINRAHGSYADDAYIIGSTSSFLLFWDQSDNRFVFSDRTNTIVGNGRTLVDGQLIQLAIVAEKGSLKIYVNGVQDATGSTYTPPTLGAYMYLGSDSAAAKHFGATYMGLLTFSQALTAAEILAHYTNTQPHYAGGDGLGQVLHPVPWAWFDQGDDITDNDYDASSVWNNFYAGGIPGNYPAETQWLLEINDANFATDQALYFFNQTFRWQNFNWRNNDNIIRNGTAASITTTDGIFGETFIYTPGQYNKNYYAYIRCIDAGSDLRARFRFQPGGSGVAYNGEYFYFTPDAATYKGFVIGPFSPGYQPFDMVDLSESSCAIGYSRTTGSGTLTVDYNMIMPDPLKIYLVFAMTSLSFIVKNKVAYAVTTSGLVRLADAVVTGSIQELVPGVANFIVAVTGNSGVANATARTIGWKIYVTPRWALV